MAAVCETGTGKHAFMLAMSFFLFDKPNISSARTEFYFSPRCRPFVRGLHLQYNKYGHKIFPVAVIKLHGCLFSVSVSFNLSFDGFQTMHLVISFSKIGLNAFLFLQQRGNVISHSQLLHQTKYHPCSM